MARNLASAALILVAFTALCGKATAAEVHKQTFRSPTFQLPLGGVFKKFYGPMEMPTGHVAIRSFSAQIVGKDGPVPLSDVYVHHWIAVHMYRPEPQLTAGATEDVPRIWLSKQDDVVDSCPQGLCSPSSESLYDELDAARMEAMGISSSSECNPSAEGGKTFGVGAETRHTSVSWPAPYGVEIGNPADVPPGMSEQYWFQIHVIDTRAAVSAKSCLECFCQSYNVTIDEYGRPIPADYTGGLLCCYNGGHCETVAGASGEGKDLTLWLEYTVEWTAMDACTVPIGLHGLDVTTCTIEYNIDSCEVEGGLSSCVDTRTRQMVWPTDGRIVFAVGHQHVGGAGIRLYGEDATLICDSTPLYGRGHTAGDEAGYVTGMGICNWTTSGYRLKANESLTVESSYSKLGGGHTGVMGLFFVAVARDGEFDETTCAAESGKELEAAQKYDDMHVWQSSMMGAFAGLLVGLSVAGAIGGLAVALIRQQRGIVEYASIEPAYA